MSSESKFIIVEKTDCFDTNGIEFAEVLAHVSIGNIIENLEKFSKEIDFFFYLPGNGNKRIDKNTMNTINEISLDDALLLTKNSKNPRFRWVYSLLKEIKKDNKEVAIVHYIS